MENNPAYPGLQSDRPSKSHVGVQPQETNDSSRGDNAPVLQRAARRVRIQGDH